MRNTPPANVYEGVADQVLKVPIGVLWGDHATFHYEGGMVSNLQRTKNDCMVAQSNLWTTACVLMAIGTSACGTSSTQKEMKGLQDISWIAYPTVPTRVYFSMRIYLKSLFMESQ